MKKSIIAALVTVLIICAGIKTAAADEYNWVEMFSFPAEKLVYVPKDYAIYIFTDGNGYQSLLFTCHGWGNERDGYMAKIGGEWYTDYASAVDNEIRYHINRGEILEDSFEKVYFLTSYSGYAPSKSVTMPVLGKELQMAVYIRGLEGISEQLDTDGYVRHVSLWGATDNIICGYLPPQGNKVHTY